MGIFSSIKNAIWGEAEKKEEKKVEPKAEAKAIPMEEKPVKAAPPKAIDVADLLTNMARINGQDLNWQSSIVDLMKLTGIDPSLANRKELASELGYTGELNGSAEMNIWLHKAVMKALAENGGMVPANMLD